MNTHSTPTAVIIGASSGIGEAIAHELNRAGLVARHFRTGEFRLRPVERDRFQGQPFGDVRFVRDAGGRVTAFTANSERVRGLRFDRRD